MNTIATDILNIGYETGGSRGGLPVLLLHGWPDEFAGGGDWSRI
jgi:hypothetical protein